VLPIALQRRRWWRRDATVESVKTKKSCGDATLCTTVTAISSEKYC